MENCHKKAHNSILALVKEVELALKDNVSKRPFTIAFSNWINGFEFVVIKSEESKGTYNGKLYRVKYYFELTIFDATGRRVLIDMQEVSDDNQKKNAYETCYRNLTLRLLKGEMRPIDFEDFCSRIGVGKTQMDIAVNGKIDGPEEAQRESNVILEVDEMADQENVVHVSSDEICKKLASTEQPFDLIGTGYSMMNRWYPLQQIKIDESTSELFSLRIPQALYADSSCVNLLPLRGFIYGDLDIEFKLVLNSAPFHAGRIIMGIFYCPQGTNRSFNRLSGLLVDKTDNKYRHVYTDTKTEIASIYGMVQRPHVFLDLGQSSSGGLLVKYNYNKPYVRLLDYSINNDVNPGVTGGYFVNLKATMLTPLRTADDNPKYVNCTLYYRFVKAKLTGMTRQHELGLTQMDAIGGLLGGVLDTATGGLAGSGMEIIKGIERQLTRKGKVTTNRDKPSMQFNSGIIIPRPRNHFPNGVGLADPIIMGMDVKSLTSQFEDQGYGPKSYLEYAKIPGICSIFQWKLTDKDTIFSQHVQPYKDYVEPTYGATGESNLTALDPIPIHIAANGFMYWGGTIVYEFDFVKTAYHKGSLMISISYGKDTDDKIGSNYEKIIDIQESTKIKVTVPYIYDTIARRTNNSSYITAWPQPGNWHPDSLPTYNRTKISLVVMNPLIDIGSVSNQIDVIVWKYAGEDFFLGSLCQVNNYISYTLEKKDSGKTIPDFPRALNPTELTTAVKYLDNLPHTQMDYEDFTPGPVENERMHTGDETNFKNLLRVPVRILTSISVAKANSLQIPVVPLSVELMRYYVNDSGRLAMTHQSQIVKMFRMWRGTLRYTFVASGNKPVYISYLPPDGTWKNRERSKYFDERIITVSGSKMDTSKRLAMPGFFESKPVTDISGTGNYTTMILPQVNPSEQVEVPWNLPVTWALMNQDNLRVQACFRDMSYGNNGHLVIYSDDDCTVSVFLSVGDDFEMGAFCGLTDAVNLSNGVRMDDARYKTQMDFPSNELLSDEDLIYYSCTEGYSFMEKTRQQSKKFIKTYAKPILLGTSFLLPSPASDLLRGCIVAHTVNSVERQIQSIGDAAEGVSKIVTPKCIKEINEVPVRFNKISKLVEETTLHKLNSVLDGCVSVTESAGKVLGTVQGEAFGDFYNWILKSFNFMSGGFMESIKNTFQRIYNFIMELDYVSVVKEIVKSFATFGIMASDFVTRKLALLKEMLMRVVSYVIPESFGKTQGLISQNELDIAEFNSSDHQTLIGLLLGGILAIYGNSNTNWQKSYQKDKNTWINDLINIKFITGTNSCLTFVKHLYSTLSKMIFKVVGGEDEEYQIKQLLSNNGGVVSDFTKNAQLFLNDFNTEAIADLVEKSKFWVTICNAYQLQACLARVKGDSATTTLKSLCKDVIKKANDNMSLFKTSAVRYEPFVVCFEGETGIGKSFLTTQVSAELVKNLGLKMPNINYRFNVCPGVDYWNLYVGQPIIIYDDWCNLVDTQSIRKEISELYQLKTSNVMNAPMAELSEKKTVVNPFAVLLATNNPFPQTNTLIDETPLYRRRDLLVKVKLRDGVDRSNPKVYKKFNHLEFGIYDNVTKNQKNFVWLNYAEFRRVMLKKHLLYHQQESQNVKTRIEILSQVLEEQALVHKDIADPFTLQARSLYEMERIAEDRQVVKSLPSEMLQYQVRNLIQLIEENFKIVKAGDFSFVIEDKTKADHSIPVAATQAWSDTGYTYFVAPIVKTYNTLHSYLSKWIDLGFHCSRCMKSALNTRALMKCVTCGNLICGDCCRSKEGIATCACGSEVKVHVPKFLDVLISYVVQAATNVFSPTDWKNTLAIHLVNVFLKFDIGVPLLVLNFLTNSLGMIKIKENIKGPIKIGEIPKTQMSNSLKSNLPEGLKLVKIRGDGNCLVNAIGKGLIDKGKYTGKMKDLIAKCEKHAPRGEKGWFTTDVHAKFLAKEYGVRIHLMEQSALVEDGWLHSIINGEKVVQKDFNVHSSEAASMIHVINEGGEHFDLLVYDTEDKSVPLAITEIAPIKFKPMVTIKLPEDNLQIPKTWWFESELEGTLNEIHCKHKGISEAIKDLVDFDISVKGATTMDGTFWPFKRCNKECEFSVSLFRQLATLYFDTNQLTMKEHLDMVRKGLCDLDDEVVPKIFQPEWSGKKMESIVAEVTSEQSWLPSFIQKVLNVSVVGGFFAIMYKFVGKMLSSLVDIFGSAAQLFLGATQFWIDSPTKRDANQTAGNSRKTRRTWKARGKTQIQKEDSEHYTNIKEKICQNYVILRTDRVKRMIGLGIFGSKILIPKHYIAPLQKATEIELYFFNTKHETQKLNPRNLDIQYFSDKDCAILSVSKAIYFSDIRKFFHTVEEYNSFEDIKGEIVVPKDEILNSFNIKFQGILPVYEAWDDFTSQVYRTEGAIEYNFEQRGACGSVILCKEKNRPIVGIHIAGHAGVNRGTGARIRVEELNFENPIKFADLPYDLEEEGLLDFGEDVNIEYLGKLEQSLIPFLPTKTNFENSVIDNHFETPHKMEPAILSAKDPRYEHKEASPLIYGVKKHGKPTIDFDKELVLKASKYWQENLLQFKWTFPHKVKIYDLKSATLGLMEVSEYYDWLPDSTSAGWPYNTYRKEGQPLSTKKKNWLFYERDPITLRPIDVEFDEQIIKDIERDMNLRKQGIMAPVVFQDVLKDERRPIEKLMKPGGTRVFSMSPVTASIVLRQYTLDLTSYLRKNRLNNWIGIGINPDGPEWGKLVTILRTKGDNIFSIDFTNFGPGLNIEVVYEFYELMRTFYGNFLELSEEDSNVMRCLIQELMYSTHLAGGTLYRTKSGSPSGAAITVEINSFVHLMYINLCWQIIGRCILLHEKDGKSEADDLFLKQYGALLQYFEEINLDYDLYADMDGNQQEFYENLSGVVYGDDGIFSIKDEFKEVFNAKTIQLVLQAHGICATDSTKGETIIKYGPLNQMTFLKRGFQQHIKHKGEWLAPINLDSVEECARWVRKGDSVENRTLENVHASLLLAYGHGPQYYDQWRIKLNGYLKEEDLPQQFLSWENIDQMFYPDYYLGTIKTKEMDAFSKNIEKLK